MDGAKTLLVRNNTIISAGGNFGGVSVILLKNIIIINT